MKRKFDYVIENSEGFHRDIFRIYPVNTHIHSFNDEPPKNWKEVYKVYYSWAFIRQWYKDDSNEIKESEIILKMDCDECSDIPNLSGMLKYVMETGDPIEGMACGQPAGEWDITQSKGFDGKNEPYEYYKIQVFDNWYNKGYRFWFNKDEVLEFCEWLNNVNQYLLEHGEGI